MGVYKPVASGCRREGGRLISDDALGLLWRTPASRASWTVFARNVWPPLAPHLASRAEGKDIDRKLLRDGLDYWLACSDIVLVEGAGGLALASGRGTATWPIWPAISASRCL